jgi:hypothetical protein
MTPTEYAIQSEYGELGFKNAQPTGRFSRCNVKPHRQLDRVRRVIPPSRTSDILIIFVPTAQHVEHRLQAGDRPSTWIGIKQTGLMYRHVLLAMQLGG